MSIFFKALFSLRTYILVAAGGEKSFGGCVFSVRRMDGAEGCMALKDAFFPALKRHLCLSVALALRGLQEMHSLSFATFRRERIVLVFTNGFSSLFSMSSVFPDARECRSLTLCWPTPLH